MPTLPSASVTPDVIPDGPDTGFRAALAIMDDDGEEILFDAEDAATLLALTGGLDDATISGCPGCRSRVLACLALVDLLDLAPPHRRREELIEFADDAPTSHCYVLDLASPCRHERWLDPGRLEWIDVVTRGDRPAPGPRR